MMVIQNSPASGAIEGGRVLPEPGKSGLDRRSMTSPYRTALINHSHPAGGQA